MLHGRETCVTCTIWTYVGSKKMSPHRKQNKMRIPSASAVVEADKTEPSSIDGLHDSIRTIIIGSQQNIVRSINSEMVSTYFNIGKLIVESEQRGQARAGYGERTMTLLSQKLVEEFGKGFSTRNLRNMRGFYLKFRIWQTLSAELSWSHYSLLMRLDDDKAISFYMKEAASERWSVRELERQIDSMLYERLALSRDKKGVLQLAKRGQVIDSPASMVKNPYVLEFLNFPQRHQFTEKELETALVDNLQEFLLELGKGFMFVARQKHICLDGEHFYIDLVFYNKLLRCYVLIDLKIGKLTHQDLGQMQMYVNIFDREIKEKAESPTVGIILCRDKKETIARYTLPKDNKQIFASKYQLYLPSEKELETKMDAFIEGFDQTRKRKIKKGISKGKKAN